MEEKKKAKVADFKPAPEKPQKMSYEQLENVAHQLSEQAKQLYTRLQEVNMTNIFKRLDYLFKVIENAHAFNKEFVSKCVDEIESIMTVPESEENVETKSGE